MISSSYSGFGFRSSFMTFSRASYPFDASSILPMNAWSLSIYETIIKEKDSSFAIRQLIFLSFTPVKLSFFKELIA